MNITAKHIERSNIVSVFKEGVLTLPDPSQLFAAYTTETTKGALYSDNPAMLTKIFEFPVLGLMWIFEPTKIRLEDKHHRYPEDSKLPQEFRRVLGELYKGIQPVAYGFNFDVMYRFDTVIPVQEIMKSFVKPETLEEVIDFGWQYTLTKEKGKRAETYFLKAVSPLELNVHANFQINEANLPKDNEFQKQFERSYQNIDNGVKHIAF
jgi:hypothetical protein